MGERADVLVVGGGIVGTSVAWALAARGVGDVAVVDLDMAGLYASSELNAGGARATWWQPVNVESCRLTLDFFRSHAERFGFLERGYLWLYADPELHARALRQRAMQNRFGLGVESLAPGEIWERFPLLDGAREEIVGATWSPRDGLVNPNAVRSWYREQAERLGVRFLDHHYAAGVATARTAGPAGSGRRVTGVDLVELSRGAARADGELVREVLTRHRVPRAAVRAEHRIACEACVDCLGAWSALFLARIGLRDVTEPVRRQLALVDVERAGLAPGAELDARGMIVDPSGLYFHPEGHWVLAGYSLPDEAPGFDFDYDGDAFFEGEIWPRLAHRIRAFDRARHVRGWSGLYAVTPDRSGIVGPVAGFSNLFEAHSFTGRGVMQSYGVGRGLAAWIASGAWDEVDLSPLARDRFDDRSRWVMEDLHT